MSVYSEVIGARDSGMGHRVGKEEICTLRHISPLTDYDFKITQAEFILFEFGILNKKYMIYSNKN